MPRFLSINEVMIERTIRANGTSIIHRHEVNGRILAKSERLADDNWFSEEAQRTIGNPGHLKELLKAKAIKYDANNPQSATANRSGKTIGHYSGNGRCRAFSVGYKLRVGSLYDNDPGNIDTIVNFAGCN